VADRIVGYRVSGVLYHPADVGILIESESGGARVVPAPDEIVRDSREHPACLLPGTIVFCPGPEIAEVPA